MGGEVVFKKRCIFIMHENTPFCNVATTVRMVGVEILTDVYNVKNV